MSKVPFVFKYSTFSLIYFILLTFQAQAQDFKYFEKKPLTIWIRVFDESFQNQIEPYLNHLYDELSPYFELELLICTKPQDPILKKLEQLPHLPIKTIFADMHSFSSALNQLIHQTDAKRFVLCLSFGMEIKASRLIEALGWLNGGTWIYGWKIDQFENDGTAPGKGWYNTAALYSPTCLQWLNQHTFPTWIDNGVEGSLSIEGKNVPIGGNEEVWLMADVIKDCPKAFFVLDTKNHLHIDYQTGTSVNYETKLKRKEEVAKYYLENKMHLDVGSIWEHLFVIQEDGTIKNASQLNRNK